MPGDCGRANGRSSCAYGQTKFEKQTLCSKWPLPLRPVDWRAPQKAPGGSRDTTPPADRCARAKDQVRHGPGGVKGPRGRHPHPPSFFLWSEKRWCGFKVWLRVMCPTLIGILGERRQDPRKGWGFDASMVSVQYVAVYRHTVMVGSPEHRSFLLALQSSLRSARLRYRGESKYYDR